MPRVSIFYGIVIYFYYDDHPPPHFHAMYEGIDAQFDLNGNLLKGSLPPKAVKLIQEWTSVNKNALIENWELAQKNLPLNWIAPLRQSWLRPQPKGSRFTVHSSRLRKKQFFKRPRMYLPLQTVNREPGTVNHIRQGLQLLRSNKFSCFL